jgi:hypothetical protein
MNKVLKELVDGQREIAAVQGGVIPLSDEELGPKLLPYFAACPACKGPLDFVPRVAIEVCQGREHFLTLYGVALRKHYDRRPECKAGVKKLFGSSPKEQEYLESRRGKVTEEDLRRWGLRE